MSINDLLESELVIPILIIFGLAFFIGIPILIVSNEKKVYGENEHKDIIRNSVAIIVDKRTTRDLLTRNIEVAMVTFEFEDGSRIELAVRDGSSLIVGDSGMLKYQGRRFIRFDRGNSNGE